MSDGKSWLKKNLLILNTLTFSSTQILLFTLLPILSEQMSVSLSVIIGCFSLGSFLFLWGAPYWSSKSDKIGRDQVMSIGLFGLATSFFLMVVLLNFSIPLGATITLALLLMSRILYGTLASSIVPVAQLSFADLNKSGDYISRMFSHSLALNIGRSLGPLLLLVGHNHLETLLLSISAWSFSLLVMNFILATPMKNAGLNIPHSVAAFSQWKSIASSMKLPLLLTILFTTYTGLLHSSLGDTLTKVFSLTGVEASTLMAKVLLVGSVVMIVSQIIGKMLLQNKLKLTMGIGLASLTVGAILFALLAKEAHVWFAIGFVSLGIALIYPSHMALVHANYPKESIGKNVGLLASGNTIGYALGGALASLFLNFNINIIALLIVASLCLVALVSSQRMKA